MGHRNFNGNKSDDDLYKLWFSLDQLKQPSYGPQVKNKSNI